MIQEWFKDLLNYVREDLARSEVESIAITADGWTNYAGEHFTTLILHVVFFLEWFNAGRIDS